MDLLETFGVPLDAAPDVAVDTLGVERARILRQLNDAFPLLLGINNNSHEQRAAIFEAGMASKDMPERFGKPWTVGRLKAVLAHCAENSWADNGSD